MTALTQENLHWALMVSLLSVWVLVGLFFYLNHFTRREYFTIWTAAWLFYALWLTLSLQVEIAPFGSVFFVLKQCCVGISAVFILWGSLRFLGLPARQTSFGLFMLFIAVWTAISPRFVSAQIMVEIPIFSLLALCSAFAGSSFFRMRKQVPLV